MLEGDGVDVAGSRHRAPSLRGLSIPQDEAALADRADRLMRLKAVPVRGED